MSALGVPPDVACVNAAMDAASKSGDHAGALATMDLLRGLAPRATEASQEHEDSPQLDLKGLRPNGRSYAIAIKACRKVLLPLSFKIISHLFPVSFFFIFRLIMLQFLD